MFNDYEPKLAMDDPIINEIAKKYKKNAGQICIKWGLQHGTSVIPKGTGEEHIVGNLDVLDWELSSEDYEVCHALNSPTRCMYPCIRGHKLIDSYLSCQTDVSASKLDVIELYSVYWLGVDSYAL